MADLPSLEKPNLLEIEESDGQEGVEHAILEYHRNVIQMPVLYEKGQGPQEQVSGVWIGGRVLSLADAREYDLAPHVAEMDELDEQDAFDLDAVEALLAGEDAEPHTSRLNRALRWLWPLIGDMPYGWWTNGAVPSGDPAWADNARAPDRSLLHKRNVFCAGVPNLLLRSVGKRIPSAGSLLYDGGTAAYGTYFRGYSIAFHVDRVQPGDLLLDFYQSSAHQGHVVVVLNGKVLLQSYDGGAHMEGGFNGPGLNKNLSAAVSARYNDYDIIVRRQNWIDYAGDQPGFKAVA